MLGRETPDAAAAVRILHSTLFDTLSVNRGMPRKKTYVKVKLEHVTHRLAWILSLDVESFTYGLSFGDSMAPIGINLLR